MSCIRVVRDSSTCIRGLLVIHIYYGGELAYLALWGPMYLRTSLSVLLYIWSV